MTMARVFATQAEKRTNEESLGFEQKWPRKDIHVGRKLYAQTQIKVVETGDKCRVSSTPPSTDSLIVGCHA